MCPLAAFEKIRQFFKFLVLRAKMRIVRQNPTKGHVAFSGFSAGFPPSTYGIVFKMP